jgi:beta-phosphoglucomutase
MRVKRPKGILFDNDGVLISSEELHLSAWNELLHQMKLPYEQIKWEGLVGFTSIHILEQLLNQFVPGWTKDQFDLEALALKKNDIYLKIAETQLAPYPGVREGLEWLKSEGIPCSVVSNAKRRELVYAMDTLHMRSYFQAIISRDDSPYPKPHPAMYEMGAVSLSLSPDECLAIDDTPTGLESALLAGCLAASVTTNYPKNYLQAPIAGRPDLKPIWVGTNISQFFDWLKTLES